jgi:AraC-like DNA-binding protein
MSKLGVALFDRINSPVTIKESDTDNRDGQCLNLLMKLLKTEINEKSQLTRIPTPRNPDNIKITEFIGDNFNRKLRLSDFTDVIHYSERHLTRIFKEDLKISIFEYLKLYRIFQSSLMICHSDNPKTITEIAFSCGYDSLSFFYNDFIEISLDYRRKNHPVFSAF